MDSTVLPIHVDTIEKPFSEKKSDDVQPELKAGRVLWCINPVPQIVQLINARIMFIFVTTLIMWFGFLLFSLINVAIIVKEFPKGINKDKLNLKDSIREYYNTMITGMLFFSLTSTALLAMVHNSLLKEPKNPLQLTFLIIHDNTYFTLFFWIATTGRPMPLWLFCVLYSFLLCSLVLMDKKSIFVQIKKLTLKYRIKYSNEKRVESGVVESWVEPIADSN